jgi:hypothetical protein
MEEVCERKNLKAALKQVQANKGSPAGLPFKETMIWGGQEILGDS